MFYFDLRFTLYLRFAGEECLRLCANFLVLLNLLNVLLLIDFWALFQVLVISVSDLFSTTYIIINKEQKSALYKVVGEVA